MPKIEKIRIPKESPNDKVENAADCLIQPVHGWYLGSAKYRQCPLVPA
jgi:hypothetical protein